MFYLSHSIACRLDRSVTGKRKLLFTACKSGMIKAQDSNPLRLLAKVKLRDAIERGRYAEITCVRK